MSDHQPQELNERPSIIETLKRAYEAGGYAWDEIDDPVAYIARMRGNCEQCDCPEGDRCPGAGGGAG